MGSAYKQNVQGMMLLLACMAVVASHKNSSGAATARGATAVPLRMVTAPPQLAFVPLLAGDRRFRWVKNNGRSASVRPR